jgi:2-polyprenyl-3-methyl-5-hydroxy-6-metoxy-1,4-benzoquinol methylase
MAATGGNGLNKSERADQRRTSYAEAKLQSKKDQPDAAARACERLLTYLNRLGLTRQGGRLLDLGCGTGRLTVELAARGYDVYGVDINPDFVEIAQDKVKTRGVSAHFMTSPAERLPFDDKFFDICIANSVLEHVTDWKKTISEVARILKPGGTVFLLTTHALYPLPSEVKHIPCLSYIQHRLRKRIIDVIAARFPKLVGYSLTPGQHWFTHTGLRKTLSKVNIKRSWDIFDVIDRQDIPPRFRFASWLLPLIKKLPYPYIRDIAHLPRPSVMLISQKD